MLGKIGILDHWKKSLAAALVQTQKKQHHYHFSIFFLWKWNAKITITVQLDLVAGEEEKLSQWLPITEPWRTATPEASFNAITVRRHYNAGFVPSQHFVSPSSPPPPYILQSGGPPHCAKQINGDEIQGGQQDLMEYKQNKFFKHLQWQRAPWGIRNEMEQKRIKSIILGDFVNCNSITVSQIYALIELTC